MTRRVQSCLLCTAVALVLAGSARPAAAAFDMSGKWFVQLAPVYSQTEQWDVTQTGTSVTVTPTPPCSFTNPSCEAFTGTIDPMNGVVTFDSAPTITLAPDGRTFTSSPVEAHFLVCDE